MRRRVIETIAAVILNPFIPNFLRGRIHQGSLKHVCVPALNCYSCPAAAGACPIGALQVSLGSLRGWFSDLAGGAAASASLYAAGVVLLVGAAAGRFACGWLCPFGFMQELVHKVRRRTVRLPRWAARVKFVVLAVFVVGLPLLVPYPLSPPFCKWICPAGTLEGGVPLVGLDKLGGRGAYDVGFLFLWKVCLAAAIMFGVVFISRFFCRAICPLGAAWGLFNRASLLAIRVDREACTRCGFCRTVCPVDIYIYAEPDSAECVRCLNCLKCPESAVKVVVRGRRRGLENKLATGGFSGDDYAAGPAERPPLLEG